MVAAKFAPTLQREAVELRINEKRENAKEASLRPLICAVCFSTLTGRIAAQRRHVDGAGHVHHSGPVR